MVLLCLVCVSFRCYEMYLQRRDSAEWYRVHELIQTRLPQVAGAVLRFVGHQMLPFLLHWHWSFSSEEHQRMRIYIQISHIFKVCTLYQLVVSLVHSASDAPYVCWGFYLLYHFFLSFQNVILLFTAFYWLEVIFDKKVGFIGKLAFILQELCFFFSFPGSNLIWLVSGCD